MPYMQAMVESANAALNGKNIGTFNPKNVALGAGENVALGVGGLSAAVGSLGVPLKDPAKAYAYLDSWPVGLQDIIRAAVYSAVLRKLPVTFAWLPGYDFKVTVTEAAGIPESPGGMTIVLESKYP